MFKTLFSLCFILLLATIQGTASPCKEDYDLSFDDWDTILVEWEAKFQKESI
jgi:hypothetical protein